ncbi:MAG: deoxyguanosinetriphosphate triphosphohydrolase [Atopobiaceae bacterium]|jgi:dGTPase|nr:deoxyguanosinetriphosphate triphosphohydrolase [Atopobiaceae bacterium]
MLTRESFEADEHRRLGPYAAYADQSSGRLRPEEPDPLRTCYQRDRDRILHSKSFRRLAHKTQVFLAPEGDHYRTRLIHTLEVTQIAVDIARSLRLNEDLAEAIALGHDLGHTPFGHTGEDALSRAMARYRGLDPDSADARLLYRHNVQSVRIVEKLEKDGRGLNLTLETTDGILNHTGSGRARTLEGRVVSVADRIAYVTHDIDDAERACILTEGDLPEGPRSVLGATASQRISTMVRDLVDASSRAGDIRMSDEVWDAMMSMRSFLFERVYAQSDAKFEEPKANRMIGELFDHYITHMDEVPEEYRLHAADHPDRQVADLVSSMTDRYAIRTYEQLKVPRAWRGDDQEAQLHL